MASKAKNSAKKSTPVAKPPEKARGSWHGMLRFGLVSFPAEAFNAHSQEADHFALHQLHAECHSRIHYQKICPIHGAVTNEEIVSGYEFRKGRYVEIEPDEIAKLRSENEKALTIDTFIAPEEIDLIYLDGRMYYLSPDGEQAREPYTIFLESLRKQDRWAVGRIVFSGKEQIVIVRPYQSAMQMALLNFATEIRDPADIVAPPAEVRGSDKKFRLAEQLIENWTDDKFDFASYKDLHFEKMKELIEAKVEGREIVTPEVEDEPAVINLMDALKKSIRKPHGPPAATAHPGSRSRKAPASKKPARKSTRQRGRHAS